MPYIELLQNNKNVTLPVYCWQKKNVTLLAKGYFFSFLFSLFYKEQSKNLFKRPEINRSGCRERMTSMDTRVII